MKKNDYLKILPYIAVIFVMFCSMLIIRHKNQLSETRLLPFYNVNVADVADGTYLGKTYTSYMHVQLEVTVKNHVITHIEIIENTGSKGLKVEPIIDEMVKQNKSVVPAIKGEEMASVVFISCVDSALKQGLSQEILQTLPLES